MHFKVFSVLYSFIHSFSRRNMLSIRLDRRARRLESNNRERRRMHELNAAFQVSFHLQRELRKVEFANFTWVALVVFIIRENDDFSNKAKLRQVSWEDHIFILAFRTERSLEYFVLFVLSLFSFTRFYKFKISCCLD